MHKICNLAYLNYLTCILVAILTLAVKCCSTSRRYFGLCLGGVAS